MKLLVRILACAWLSAWLAQVAAADAIEEDSGELIPIMDACRSNAYAPNPLYLRAMPDQPWAVGPAARRVPVLISETVGLARDLWPVSVRLELPEPAGGRGVRVGTPGGAEIPAQVAWTAGGGGMLQAEVTFLVSIPAGGQFPVFVYYDGPAEPAPESHAAMGIFQLRDAGDAYLLQNPRTIVAFPKKSGPNGALVSRLQPQGSTRNQVGGGRTRPEGHHSVLAPDTPARIVEDGPVRKSIRFDDGTNAVTYSLTAALPAVFFEFQGRSPRQFMTWLPGGDTVNDDVYFETTGGVRRVSISYGQGVKDVVSSRLKPLLKEGWIAFLDRRRGELAGNFFDTARDSVNLTPHSRGFDTRVYIADAGQGQGVLYADRDSDFVNCRDAYIAWKNPLQIALGASQERHDIPVTRPMFGRDFLRIHLASWPPEAARASVENIKEHGGNAVLWWASRVMYPSKFLPGDPLEVNYLAEGIRAAHQAGLAFIAAHPLLTSGKHFAKNYPELDPYKFWASADGAKKSVYLSPLLGRDLFVGAAGELAAMDVDGIWLLDERSYQPSFLADAEKAAFRQAWRMEPPASLASKNLKDPAEFAFFMFSMNTLSQLMEEMSARAWSVKPGLFLGNTTSPGNLRVRSGYHDLERYADCQTSIVMDLYSNRPDILKIYLARTRGAMGNRRPAMSISGYAGWDLQQPVELNQYLHVMFGANSLAFFSLGRPCNPASGLGVKKAFEFFAYTGLDKFLARARPLPFAGIVRDQAAFLAGLQAGKYAAISDYDNQVNNLLVALGNIPADILYGKYCRADLLSEYAVVLVPDNPAVSGDLALELKKYVEQGGNLILEGAAVSNAVLAELAGVQPAGAEQAGLLEVSGTEGALAGWDWRWRGAVTPVASRGAELLACFTNGAPAVTVASAGRGKVVYSVPVLSAAVITDDQPRRAVWKLVEFLAGALPLKVEPLGAESPILATMLTHGRERVVCAYNTSALQEESFALRLGPMLESPAAWVSFKTGREIPAAGGLAQFRLGPNQVDFYQAVDVPGSWLPETTIQTNGAIHAARRPGMEFLQSATPAARAGRRAKLKDANKMYVGIFDPGRKVKKPLDLGAAAMLEECGQWDKLAAETINSLEPEILAQYDVVVLPNRSFPTDYPPIWERHVRQYVEAGGGVLLVHHSVGYGDFSEATLLFPEVAMGQKPVASRKMRIAGDHPAASGSALRRRFADDLDNPAFVQQYRGTEMPAGQEGSCGFPDYIGLKIGPAGALVVEGMADNGNSLAPAVAAGSVGRGRVVMSGMCIGCRQTPGSGDTKFEEALSPGLERNLLMNSLFWLGDKTGPEGK